MRRLGERLRAARRHGDGATDLPADDPSASTGHVGRRAVLLGAAATAGVVAAAGTPVVDVERAASAPVLRAGSTAVAAAQVSVDPAGEITDCTVQDVLVAIDQRLGRAHLIDDQQVGMTLVDDFMGGFTDSGTIGQLGWTQGNSSTATGLVSLPQLTPCPGVVSIGNNGAAGGWQQISLGTSGLVAAPVFVCEWRLKVASTDNCTIWVGLHDGNSAAGPTVGFFFRYSPTTGPQNANLGNWQAVCSRTEGGNGTMQAVETAVDTGVAVDTAAYHRLRIVSDGGGNALFAIDGNQLPFAISDHLPGSGHFYAPAATIASSVADARSLAIDYFALRYEQAR